MSESDNTVIGTGAAQAPVKLCLRAADGSVVVVEDELVVGRGADCGLVLADERISRKHAVLKAQGGRLLVEDLGSVNGTCVNGLRIQAATPLGVGDSLSFEQHGFTVVLAEQKPDSDATVVGTPPPVAAAKPVAAPVAANKAAAARPLAAAVPGSWVEGGSVDGTQILASGTAGAVSRRDTRRASTLPHLLVFEGGGQGRIIELPAGNANEADVWEMGRDQACEVNLADTAVSMRHAQLIHQSGRWKLVNLVSTNGIFVNDEKKLTAYLAAGDHLRLGMTEIVFFPAESTPLPQGTGSVRAAAQPAASAAKSSLWLTLAGLLLVLCLALGGWFFL